MRRITLVLVTTVVALVVASGVALAANRIDCRNQDDGRCIGTPKDDEIIGTRKAETIRGRGGSDLIKGRGGGDKLRGERGHDTIVAPRCSFPGAQVFGGRGNDNITIAGDCGWLTVVPPPATVDCGPGKDVVRGVHRGDKIAANCERVIRS